jgi:hypothetical protein
LTIDDDVASLLQKEIRRTGRPMKQAVNDLLRAGLQQAAVPVKPKPFKIKTRKLGLPKDWTSGSVSELIEMLEGPGYR